MVVIARSPRAATSASGRAWLLATLALSIGVTVTLIALAPPAGSSPGSVATGVIFIGASVHVAATGWFYTVPEVRRFFCANPLRYIAVPIALIVATAVLLGFVVPNSRVYLVLMPYFAWQYFHYQKQNVGMSALAGVSNRAGSVSTLERRCLVAAGMAGIAGLIAHPQLLGLTVRPLPSWCFGVAGAAFVAAVVAGAIAIARRPPERRPVAFVAVYAMSLLFFAPVFVFRSPYAAATSFAVAHGYQYLLIVGLVALGSASRRYGQQLWSIGLLVTVAVAGGWLLNWGSHATATHLLGRIVFGAYLGVVMSHFVIDAGLWRLRDEFPRRFLTERLPYLLRPDGAVASASKPVVDPAASTARAATDIGTLA